MLIVQGTIPARAGEPGTGGQRWRRNRDYPRSRGGTSITTIHCKAAWGLSPLARGNLGRTWRPFRWPGTIPARAGEPDSTSTLHSLTTDYPRSRGGTWVEHGGHFAALGLSPLARGNLARIDDVQTQFGTIPARAGEPVLTPFTSSITWDYPRSRGGTAGLCLCGGHCRGLSPLARGNRLVVGKSGLYYGTIPARAGEPSFSHSALAFIRDYPRSRGGTSLT